MANQPPESPSTTIIGTHMQSWLPEPLALSAHSPHQCQIQDTDIDFGAAWFWCKRLLLKPKNCAHLISTTELCAIRSLRTSDPLPYQRPDFKHKNHYGYLYSSLLSSGYHTTLDLHHLVGPFYALEAPIKHEYFNLEHTRPQYRYFLVLQKIDEESWRFYPRSLLRNRHKNTGTIKQVFSRSKFTSLEEKWRKQFENLPDIATSFGEMISGKPYLGGSFLFGDEYKDGNECAYDRKKNIQKTFEYLCILKNILPSNRQDFTTEIIMDQNSDSFQVRSINSNIFEQNNNSQKKKEEDEIKEILINAVNKKIKNHKSYAGMCFQYGQSQSKTKDVLRTSDLMIKEKIYCFHNKRDLPAQSDTGHEKILFLSKLHEAIPADWMECITSEIEKVANRATSTPDT